MDECVCGRKMVDPIGLKDAKILIVGDEPDFNDLRVNMPYSGDRGEVLRKELSRVGIDLRQCRITFLWRHESTKGSECKGHMGDVLREMKNHPYVLLIGASTVKAFGISNIDTLIGLPVESVFFPENVKVVTVVTNPPQHSAVGEFRLGLEKFYKRVQEHETLGLEE